MEAKLLHAEGKTEEADRCIEKAASLDENDFTVYTHRQLKKLL